METGIENGETGDGDGETDDGNVCVVVLARFYAAGFHAYTGIPGSPTTTTSSFNCKLVVIICTLPYDRLLMSICCLPGLMSSVLCYYPCKVPFIRLAIWLAL